MITIIIIYLIYFMDCYVMKSYLDKYKKNEKFYLKNKDIYLFTSIIVTWIELINDKELFNKNDPFRYFYFFPVYIIVSVVRLITIPFSFILSVNNNKLSNYE
jgi:hypothetical protein